MIQQVLFVHWNELIAFLPTNLCYNLGIQAQSKDQSINAVTPCCNTIREKKAEPWYFKGVYYSNINQKTIEYFNKAIQFDYSFLDVYG